MKRNYPTNPLLQPVKGIFIYHQADDMASKAQDLIKTLCCQVMTNHENRFTVKSTRGKLQAIKQDWLKNDPNHPLSKELNACFSQIIIGGSVN